jgi:hypothetical protein
MGHVPPTWTILVPTLGERRALFERLMGALLPQLDPYAGTVRVVSWWNNGAPGLPKIRQRMVVGAGSEYTSFVDDDDLVPDYFVAEVVSALESRPDYVGWDVQCYTDGAPTAISHHSLAHGGWYNKPDAYYRDISHLNPIRRDLALLADFRKARAGQAEDRNWASQIRRTHKVRTEVVIPRVMYHYLYSTSRKPGMGSRWQQPRSIRAQGTPAQFGSPYFSYHPESAHA